MNEILVLGAVISGVVLGLVELIKGTEMFPKRFLPLVGVAIGLLCGWASFPFTDLEVVSRLWAGVVAGLGATGFFELVKSDKKKDVEEW